MKTILDKISLIGVILGFLVKLGIDMVIASILMIYITHLLYSSQLSQDKMAIKQLLLIISLALDAITDIIGGYISARIAKKSAYINSGLVGVLCLIMGVLFFSAYPRWFNITASLLVVPATLIGGFLYTLGTTPKKIKSKKAVE